MAVRIAQLVSQRFPSFGDSAAIYELLAREIHPLLAKLKEAVNSHADDIEAANVDLTDIEADIVQLFADVVALTAVVATKASKKLTIATETTATRTLQASDESSYVRCTHASGCTVTVNSGTFTAGQVTHYRGTQGVLTLVEGSGVTVNKSETLLSRKAQSPLMLVCLNDAGTEYDLFGDMDPV